MLDEADHQNPSINFNRQYPGSADAVIDSKEVEGAFSKNGFGFMQDAIAHSDRFFAGEEWVLGKQNYGAFDRGALEQELRTRYRDDFLAQWRGFLRAATVQHYGNVKDAARKLNLLSSNNSPLLALFALISSNTAVSDSDIAAAFQPAQAVVPPNANPYVGATQPAIHERPYLAVDRRGPVGERARRHERPECGRPGAQQRDGCTGVGQAG